MVRHITFDDSLFEFHGGESFHFMSFHGNILTINEIVFDVTLVGLVIKRMQPCAKIRLKSVQISKFPKQFRLKSATTK